MIGTSTDSVHTTQFRDFDPIGELSTLLGQLRRALKKQQRDTFGQDPLAGAPTELLRLISNQPGIRVGDAAKSLALAPNSASTLVGQLCALGLISREVDSVDRRVSRLTITEEGTHRLQDWRTNRKTVLSHSFLLLSQEDQILISNSVPALKRLLGTLESPKQHPPTL